MDIPIGDISLDTDWSVVLDECAVVIHLAGRVHVMNDRSQDPAAEYRRSNVDATINLALQAAERGVRRLVFVSSIKVNGEETSAKAFSPFDAPNPTDLYAQSKLAAEVALGKLAAQTGLEVVIVRPPLVYGPGVGANFARLMRLAALGLPLPFGAITNRRSMVAVENLADLLIRCSVHPAAPKNTFLVSDNHDISLPELIRMMASAMRKRTMLVPVPSALLRGAAALLGREADVNRLAGSLQVDISYTRETLGWEPPMTMQAAIERTVAHFMNSHATRPTP